MNAFRFVLCATSAALLTVSASAAPESQQVVDRYEQMLAQSPHPGTALDRVCEAYAAGDGLDALNKRWADKAKDAPAYLVMQGLLAQRRGKTAEAAKFLDEAMKRMPDKAEAWIASASVEADAGRVSTAVTRYEKALGLGLAGEDRLDAYRRMAQLQQRMLKTGDAVKTLQRMAEEYPDDPFVMSEAGDALVEAGKPAEARVIFEMLRDKQGGDVFQRLQAMLRLAEIEQQAKGRAAALVIYEKVLTDSAPTSWIHRETRQRIEDLFRREDDLPGLVTYYQERLKSQPGDVEAVYRLAGVLATLGRDDESSAQWRRAIELAPERQEFLQEYAAQMLASGRSGDAVELLRKLVRDEPQDADLSDALGEALWKVAEASGRAEDRKTALEAWGQIAPEGSNDLSRITRVAGILSAHDLKNEVLPYYQRALRIQPDAFDLREALAAALTKLGRTNDADTALAAAVAGELATPANFLSLAGAYRRLEREDDAAAAIDAGLAVDAKNFDLLALKARLLTDKEQWSAVAGMHPQLMAAAPGTQYVAELERQYIEALDNATRLTSVQERMLADFDAGKLTDEAGLRVLARMLLRANDAENSRKVLAAASKAFPASVEIARIETDFQERFGTVDGRRATLRRLSTLDMGNRAQWLAELAQSYRDEGKWDDALKLAQERIELSPASPDGYLFYAEICFAANRAEAGVQKLQEALRIASEPVNIRLRLASAYASMGNADMALRTQEEAFNQENNPEQKLRLMGALAGYYLQEGRVDELIARLKARQKAEEGTRYSAYLGEIYMQMNDYAGAREELARSLAIRPRDAGLLQQLERLSELEGNTAEKLRYARALADVSPTLDNRRALIDVLSENGAHDEAAALLRQIGPEWVKQGGGGAISLLANPNLRGPVIGLLREQLQQKHADGNLALSLAGALIADADYDEADRILAEIAAMEDSQFQFAAAPVTQNPYPGYYAGFNTDVPPVVRRLNEVEQSTYRSVEMLRNMAEMRRGMQSAAGYRSIPRFGGGMSGMSGMGLLPQISTPADARNLALALRAYVAVLKGTEDQFIKDWEKSVQKRGLSRDARIEELVAMQSTAGLQKEADALMDSQTASADDLELALTLYQRTDRGRYGGVNNTKSRQGMTDLASRLLTAEKGGGGWLSLSALQILYGAGRKDEAYRFLDGMIAQLDKADAAQMLQLLSICVGWDRIDDARRIFGSLMIRASATQGAPGIYAQAIYAGWGLAAKMIQKKETRKEGLELYALVLRQTFGNVAQVRASPMGFRMGGSGRRLNGLAPYMFSSQNLNNIVPMPTKWFDYNGRSQLESVWQQLHSLEATADFLKIIAAADASTSPADRIYMRLAGVYFQWWEGDKKGAIKTARQIAAAEPGEDFSTFLASMLIADNDYKAAEEVVAKAVAQSKEEAVRNAILGITIAVRQKNKDRATALAEQFLKLWPQSEERSVVGQMLSSMQLSDLAQKVRTSGVPRNSSSGNSSEPAVVRRLESLQRKENGRDQAVAIARSTLLGGTPGTLIDPNDNIRSTAIETMEHFEAREPFIAEVQESLKKDPDSVKWNALMAELALADSTKRGLPYLIKLAQLQPANRQLQLNVARMLQSNERGADAIVIFRRLMETDFAGFMQEGLSNAATVFREQGKQDEFIDTIERLAKNMKTNRDEQSSAYIGSLAQQAVEDADVPSALRLFRISFSAGNNDSGTQKAYLQLLKQTGAQDVIDKEAIDILFPPPAPPRPLMAGMFPHGHGSPWNSWESDSESRSRNVGSAIVDLVSPKMLPELARRAKEFRSQFPDEFNAQFPDICLRVRMRDETVLKEIRESLKSNANSSSQWQSLSRDLIGWPAARPLAIEMAVAARDNQSRTQPYQFVRTTMPLINMAIDCDEKELARKEMLKVIAKMKDGGHTLLNQLGSSMLFTVTEKALDLGLAEQAQKLLAEVRDDAATEDYMRRRIAAVDAEYRLAAGEDVAAQAIVWQAKPSSDAKEGTVTLSWRIGAARPTSQSGDRVNVSISERVASVLNGKFDLELIAEIYPNAQQRIAMLPRAKYIGQWTGKLPADTARVSAVLRARGSSTTYTGVPIRVGSGPNLVANPGLEASSSDGKIKNWMVPAAVKFLAHGGPDNVAPAMDIDTSGRTVKLIGDPILLEPDQDYMQMIWCRSLTASSSISVGILLLDEKKKEIDDDSCSMSSDRTGWRLATQYFSTRESSSGMRTITKKAKWMQPYIRCSYPSRVSGMWIGKITPMPSSED